MYPPSCEKVCEDEATGARIEPCANEQILKGPAELAAVAKEQVRS